MTKHEGRFAGMKVAGARAVSAAAALALAMALVPAPAFAQVGRVAVPGIGGGADVGGFTCMSTQQAADDAGAGGAGGARADAAYVDGVDGVDEQAAYVEGEILVTFADNVGAHQAAAAIAALPQADTRATATSVDLDAIQDAEGEPIVVKLDEGADEAQAVRAAETLAGVAAAQLNYRYQLLDDPAREARLAAGTLAAGPQAAGALTNDPALASYEPDADENAWHLKAIDIESAWEQAKCEGTVTVAVLDTGCDMAHEDLTANVLADYAWNAYKNEPLSCDYYGHGTHVAGCIAATANNEHGTAGSSYNAKVLPINVFDAYGSDQWSSTTKALVAAYDYLFDFDDRHPECNLHVVNMSLGGYGTASADDLALQQRIKQAKERDIVSVCAGGNGINGVPQTAGHYPSDYDDAFAVTALSTDGYTPTTWCDYNSAKDICTPGEDIYSTVPLYCKMEGNANWWGYSAVSGTSMATPITAGVFALLWAARPDLTVDDAVAAVKESADNRLQIPLDWYSEGRDPSMYGAGILDAGEAVAWALYRTGPNDNTRAQLNVAADEASELLAQTRVSTDGADVAASRQWVSQMVYDQLSAAAEAARNAAVVATTYVEAADARDALDSARAVFDAALQAGTMPLADAQAKSDLRHLARNAKVDTNGVLASADGADVAAGAKWVPTALAERLLAAIDAGYALAADEEAGAQAVAAAVSELKSARQAYNAGVRTAAVQAGPGGQPRPDAAVAATVTINKAKVTPRVVKAALAAVGNAGADNVVLGKKVKKISKKAFAGTKVTTLVVNSKKLKGASVKGCLKGSQVKTVQVKVGSAKANKKFVRKYKKLFVKKVAGKKAFVK